MDMLEYLQDLARRVAALEANGSSYGTIGNADTVDSIHAATTPTASKLLPLNASGHLDLGSGNLITSGTVDGVDVSGHAARHNAGGADALSTVPNHDHTGDAGDGATLSAAAIASGTLDLARIPTTLTGKDADTVDGKHVGIAASSIPDLDANLDLHLTTGDVSATNAVFAGGVAGGDASETSGKGYIVGQSNASYSPQWKIINTNADATSAYLVFQKDSVSPAASDKLANIQFVGDDSGGNETVFALLQASCTDVTDGSEDGQLLFQTMKAGTATNTLTLASGVVTCGGSLRVSGDDGGAASTITITNGSQITARSTGVGTIKFDDATNRDCAGFITIYIGTTAYYVPVFAAI